MKILSLEAWTNAKTSFCLLPFSPLQVFLHPTARMIMSLPPIPFQMAATGIPMPELLSLFLWCTGCISVAFFSSLKVLHSVPAQNLCTGPSLPLVVSPSLCLATSYTPPLHLILNLNQVPQYILSYNPFPS